MAISRRPEGRTSYAPSSLDRALSTFVVAADGVNAGAVIRALEREGLNLSAAWGPLDDLAKPDVRPTDLVVVVEPDDHEFPDAAYSQLRSNHPRATIVVICSADHPRPQSLIWAGVDGIIFEPGADTVVGPAVRTLLAGYVVVPEGLRAGLPPPPLTHRERQMLQFVVEGLTNREIAERLYLA